MTATNATSHPNEPRAVPGRPRRGRALFALAATGTLALGLVACGSDDTTSSAAATTAASVTQSTARGTDSTAPSTDVSGPGSTVAGNTATTGDATDTTSTGSGAGTPAAPIANAVTITSPGMSYEVPGPLRPGIAAITFRNTSPEAHMMEVARLIPGTTLDQLKAALDQSEDAAGALLADGQENSVYGTPAPVGAGESTTVTAMDLQAGDYALVCFFTDADGTPHFQMGMINVLTVEGAPATESPTGDGTISIGDEGITMPDDFDGQGTFLVTNDGTATHSFSIARLDDGTTLDDYYQFVGNAQNSGTAVDGGGGVLAGGVDGLLPGQSAFLTVALSPGHYGYLSTADANGPTIPVQHGEFDVS